MELAKGGSVTKGVYLSSSTNTVSDCYDIESQFMLQSVSGVWGGRLGPLCVKWSSNRQSSLCYLKYIRS